MRSRKVGNSWDLINPMPSTSTLIITAHLWVFPHLNPSFGLLQQYTYAESHSGGWELQLILGVFIFRVWTFPLDCFKKRCVKSIHLKVYRRNCSVLSSKNYLFTTDSGSISYLAWWNQGQWFDTILVSNILVCRSPPPKCRPFLSF